MGWVKVIGNFIEEAEDCTVYTVVICASPVLRSGLNDLECFCVLSLSTQRKQSDRLKSKTNLGALGKEIKSTLLALSVIVELYRYVRAYVE